MPTSAFRDDTPRVMRRTPPSSGCGALTVVMVLALCGGAGTLVGARLQALAQETSGVRPPPPAASPLAEPINMN